MFEVIRKHLLSELSAIAAAPTIFIMAIIVVGGVIWWAVNWHLGKKIEILRERLAARNEKLADYSAKLNGASPDEAKARIDDLAVRLASLEPKRLSNEEAQAIVSGLNMTVGKLEILTDAASSSVRPFADDLMSAFQHAGWEVMRDLAIQIIPPTKSGLYVVVPDLKSLDEKQKAVFFALNNARLAYEAHSGLRIQAPPHNRDIRIMITPLDTR